MNCPVCGAATSGSIDIYVECVFCHELLTDDECVDKYTRRGRIAYAASMGHPRTYGKEDRMRYLRSRR